MRSDKKASKTIADLEQEAGPPWPYSFKIAEPDILIRSRDLFPDHRWLDVLLGLPAGFLVFLLALVIVSIPVEAVSGLPKSHGWMWVTWVGTAVLSLLICVVVGRRFPLFAWGMFLTSSMFNAVTLFLTCCGFDQLAI